MNSGHGQDDLNGPGVTIDWGTDGLTHALARGDIVVIVDTLRFSTATVTAIAHGYVVFPVPDRDCVNELAERMNAVPAVRSGEPGISLSPASFMTAPGNVNKRVILPSPNGATCAARISEGDTAYIGCFLNAQAVGEMVTALAHARRRNITVIACGEQRSVKNGSRIVYVLEEAHRVFAIEDYLAAGAIITSITGRRSAEAEVCIRSYGSSRDSLLTLLRDSFSGRYLIEHGLEADIDHAARINLYSVAPQVHGGQIARIE